MRHASNGCDAGNVAEDEPEGVKGRGTEGCAPNAGLDVGIEIDVLDAALDAVHEALEYAQDIQRLMISWY